MILARLHGDKPEYTGVVAGMSGSPVYIDGRLVGAMSYRIGQFTKEPIAGITPIEAMLQVRDGGGLRCGRCGREIAKRGFFAAVRMTMRRRSRRMLRADGDSAGVWRIQQGGGGTVWGQVPGDGADSGGGAGRGGPDGVSSRSRWCRGQAVSAVLVRGDLSMAGTCTVTYVDPKTSAGVRASDYAVWAGGYADDEGGGAGYAGVAAECVQDY